MDGPRVVQTGKAFLSILHVGSSSVSSERIIRREKDREGLGKKSSVTANNGQFNNRLNFIPASSTKSLHPLLLFSESSDNAFSYRSLEELRAGDMLEQGKPV